MAIMSVKNFIRRFGGSFHDVDHFAPDHVTDRFFVVVLSKPTHVRFEDFEEYRFLKFFLQNLP